MTGVAEVLSRDRPAMADFGLDGCVGVVTGASSGIGAQCARALDSAGATVVLLARRAARLDDLAAELSHPVVVPCDLMEPEAVCDRLQAVLEPLGRFDVLVNSAATGDPGVATRERPAEMRRILALNLLAPMLLSQLAVSMMRSGGGGSIINITSISATNSMATLPAATYVASKGGLAAVTRELAVQWARHGVRVNAIAPGWFPTEMNEQLRASGQAAPYLDLIPMRRFANLSDIDGPLLLLAGRAGAYITGQTIVVDGGLSAL